MVLSVGLEVEASSVTVLLMIDGVVLATDNVAAPEHHTCSIRRSFENNKTVVIHKITLFLR